MADTESLDGDLAGGVRIRYGSGVAKSAIGGCSTVDRGSTSENRKA